MTTLYMCLGDNSYGWAAADKEDCLISYEAEYDLGNYEEGSVFYIPPKFFFLDHMDILYDIDSICLLETPYNEGVVYDSLLKWCKDAELKFSLVSEEKLRAFLSIFCLGINKIIEEFNLDQLEDGGVQMNAIYLSILDESRPLVN